MNKEFLRMQQLAGLLTEITLKPAGLEQRIMDKWLEQQLKQEQSFVAVFQNGVHVSDDPEAIEYFAQLKQNPIRVKSLDDVATQIKLIDDRLTELAGEGPGSFYHEVVKEPLKQMGVELNLKSEVNELISKLDILYGEDEEDEE